MENRGIKSETLTAPLTFSFNKFEPKKDKKSSYEKVIGLGMAVELAA